VFQPPSDMLRHVLYAAMMGSNANIEGPNPAHGPESPSAPLASCVNQQAHIVS